MPALASVHAPRSRLVERLGLPLSIAAPAVLAAAVPIAGGDPASALWSLAVVYATIDGSDYDVEASWFQLGLHCGAPIATVPVFLALGAPLASAVGGTVFVASTCFMAFHFTAVRAHIVREVRAERALLEAELAGMRADRERDLLARDLHDTVGANLSLAALYADLLARDGGDREMARKLSTALEGATAQGLDDLRLLLDGLASDAPDLDALAAALRSRAGRVAGSVGAAIDVRVATSAGVSGEAAVPTAARYALVRVAHEATSNAIRHGRASSVSIELTHDGNAIALRVCDDGRGFDPATARPGRGLLNMRARAVELGGSFDVESSGGGTRVTVRVPARLC
jgi:signal transduction histidine kinase